VEPAAGPVVTPAALLAGIVTETFQWFADGAHWRGANGVPTRVGEHLVLSGVTVAIALAVALPLGLVLGHRRSGGTAVIALANVARAVPSFGLIVLGVVAFGISAGPVVAALVILAVPPILVNAYVGVRDVSDDLVEAATGQGMSGRQVLWNVEIPSALPLILAGIRTATVLVVATATLAAVVPGVGGLGPYIVDGIGQQDRPKAVAGAALVAALALVSEALLARLQRRVSPHDRASSTVPVADLVGAVADDP
jgi:osmoprotectant transport system permease protein